MLFQGERNKKNVLVFIGKYEDLKQKQCKIQDIITCFIAQYFKQINMKKWNQKCCECKHTENSIILDMINYAVCSNPYLDSSLCLTLVQVIYFLC